MKRRINKHHHKVERRMTTGMVMSTKYLKRLKPIYDEELLTIEYAKYVAKWCLEYLEKYDEAPGSEIQNIYSRKIRDGLKEEMAELIGDFLESISDEFEKDDNFNVDHLFDESEEYLKLMKLRLLSLDLSALVENDKSKDAEILVSDFRTIKTISEDGGDPFLDEQDLDEVLTEDESKEKDMIRFPGKLRKMLQGQLVRDQLISFMGPEKRGKTFILLDCVYRALLSRHNVLFVQAGDLSRRQINTRMYTRVSGKGVMDKFCGEQIFPIIDCKHNQNDTCSKSIRTCNVPLMENMNGDEMIGIDLIDQCNEGYRPCSSCRGKRCFEPSHWYVKKDLGDPLTWSEARRNNLAFAKRYKGKKFKLICYPNYSLSIRDLDNQLHIWQDSEGFVPDLIAIDYADILAPERELHSRREEINETWMAMRRMSQERHCLVLTVTQTDAGSYDQKVIKMTNFSEDKRKLSHVNAMYSLNQTPLEKYNRIWRLGKVVVREDECDIFDMAKVLQGLQIGRTILDSF